MQQLRRPARAGALGPRSRRGLSGRRALAPPGPRQYARPGAAPLPLRLDGVLSGVARRRNRTPDSLHPLRSERTPAVRRTAAVSVPLRHLAAALGARASGAVPRVSGLAGGDQRRSGALSLDPHGARHSAGVADPSRNGPRSPVRELPESATRPEREDPVGATSSRNQRLVRNGPGLRDGASSDGSPASIAAPMARSRRPSRRSTRATLSMAGRSPRTISWSTSTGP